MAVMWVFHRILTRISVCSLHIANISIFSTRIVWTNFMSLLLCFLVLDPSLVTTYFHWKEQLLFSTREIKFWTTWGKANNYDFQHFWPILVSKRLICQSMTQLYICKCVSTYFSCTIEQSKVIHSSSANAQTIKHQTTAEMHIKIVLKVCLGSDWVKEEVVLSV